ATEPDADGFLSVYPCDQPRPAVSQVTFTAGQTIASTVLAGLDDRRQVCIYTSATTHVVVDHQFDVLPGRSVRTVAPARVWDSRHGHVTVDRHGRGTGRTEPRSVTAVPIAGRAG